MQPILGVAIGVVLVFAVFAVVASAATEGLSALLTRRARDLEEGLVRMLDGGEPGALTSSVLQSPLIVALSRSRPSRMQRKSTDGQRVVRKPSYIDAVTFATALLDAGLWNEQLILRFSPEARNGVNVAMDQNAKDELAKKWREAGESPAAVVGTLVHNADGDGAAKQLVGLLGEGSGIDATIKALTDAGDTSAAELERLWRAAARNVTALAQSLLTPRLSAAAPTKDDVDKILKDIAATNPFVGQILMQLWRRAGSDFEHFRHEIEDWFDRQMDRVSGWYARWAQLWMFSIALALAIALNVSATTIGRGLWADPTLRANAAAVAGQTTNQPGQEGKQPSFDDLDNIGLPLGWGKTAWPGGHDVVQLLIHLTGIVAVAVAASFGAPFWFDMLNRIVNLRVAGPKPLTAAEQRTEGRSAASRP